MKKSLSRAVLLVVALLASSLSLVAVSTAPANAASYTSFSQIGSSHSWVKHGNSITITGRVGYNQSTPTYVNAGRAYLQRRNYGSYTWTTVSYRDYTASTGDLTWNLVPSRTATYRVYYAGGTYGADSYSASTSPSVKVSLRRNLHDSFARSTRTYRGRVTPSYARRYVVIQKSTCSNPTGSSCRWTTYKSVKTSGTGAWSLRLPVYARRTHFRGYVKPSSGFLASWSNYYVTTYRY